MEEEQEVRIGPIRTAAPYGAMLVHFITDFSSLGLRPQIMVTGAETVTGPTSVSDLTKELLSARSTYF